jgi:hypothetical protein
MGTGLNGKNFSTNFDKRGLARYLNFFDKP